MRKFFLLAFCLLAMVALQSSVVVGQCDTGIDDNAAIAYVLDRSGSMGTTSMNMAKLASQQGITLMRIGDRVGVVSFSGSSRTDYSLATITTDAIRSEARGAVAGIFAGGSTSIGSGLQRAFDMLEPDPSSVKEVLLLTDGYENTSPFVADVIGQFLSSGATDYHISTVAFGNGASQAQMAQLAGITGGAFAYVPNQNDFLSLAQVFNTIQNHISGVQTQGLTTGNIDDGDTDSQTVFVSPKELQQRFALLWDNPLDAPTETAVGSLPMTASGDNLSLIITDPTGQVYTEVNWGDFPEVTWISGPAIKYFVFDSPVSGDWTVEVEGTSVGGTADYVTVFTSYSCLNLVTGFDRLQYLVGESPVVLATLMEDGNPRTGATVVAAWDIVNTGTSGQLELFDDGLHADGAANDGVYGQFFADTNAVGTYRFNFTATGLDSEGLPFVRLSSESIYIDTTILNILPLVVETSVLQNPAISRYANVVVVPDQVLRFAPDVSYWVNGGPVQNLGVSLISDSGIDWQGGFEFTQNGTYSIRTFAQNLDDVTSDLTRTFNAVLAKALGTTRLTSTDGKTSLDIPGSSIQQETWFVVEASEPTGKSEDVTYRFGPSGHFGPMTVEFNYEDGQFPEEGNLTIFRQNGGSWEALPTRVFADENKVRAEVTSLGVFMLAYDSNGAGSNLVPEVGALLGNYPNPFNPTTNIKFDLPLDQHLTLQVFDISGRLIKTIFDGPHPAGQFSIPWNGTDDAGKNVASGLYFSHMTTDDYQATQKMVLMK